MFNKVRIRWCKEFYLEHAGLMFKKTTMFRLVDYELNITSTQFSLMLFKETDFLLQNKQIAWFVICQISCFKISN
jgi:NADH:ubiquinone oxidoreductase subunit K